MRELQLITLEIREIRRLRKLLVVFHNFWAKNRPWPDTAGSEFVPRRSDHVDRFWS